MDNEIEFGEPIEPNGICDLCGLPLQEGEQGIHNQCTEYESYRQQLEPVED